MDNDPLVRCLGCFALDAERYSGESQRVGNHAWWYQPAWDWLREHGYLTGSQRRLRRDTQGWYSRRRQQPPPPREIHTCEPGAAVAAAVATTSLASELAARYEVA